MAKRSRAPGGTGPAPWLLLVHQIPPHPASLRVRVWRRLQRLGAVALKASVYVLPCTERAGEDFEWVRRTIDEGGGDAMVWEARIVEGLSDPEVLALFRQARAADYAAVASEARGAFSQTLGRGPGKSPPTRESRGTLARLRRRLSEIAQIDWFGAPGRPEAEEAVDSLESARLGAGTGRDVRPARLRRADHSGRTWVTRQGVHMDRIASAWLIRRFIDPKAQFRFVPPKGHAGVPGDLLFDMFDAHFTHEGDRCTFETLVARFGLAEPGLEAVAEIVHDIDLKDAKFECAEMAGVQRLIEGICLSEPEDEARLRRGGELLDALYETFHRNGAELRTSRGRGARPKGRARS